MILVNRRLIKYLTAMSLELEKNEKRKMCKIYVKYNMWNVGHYKTQHIATKLNRKWDSLKKIVSCWFKLVF